MKWSSFCWDRPWHFHQKATLGAPLPALGVKVKGDVQTLSLELGGTVPDRPLGPQSRSLGSFPGGNAPPIPSFSNGAQESPPPSSPTPRGSPERVRRAPRSEVMLELPLQAPGVAGEPYSPTQICVPSIIYSMSSQAWRILTLMCQPRPANDVKADSVCLHRHTPLATHRRWAAAVRSRLLGQAP